MPTQMTRVPDFVLNDHMSSVSISVFHKLITDITLEAGLGMHKQMFFQVVFVFEFFCTNIANVLNQVMSFMDQFNMFINNANFYSTVITIFAFKRFLPSMPPHVYFESECTNTFTTNITTFA